MSLYRMAPGVECPLSYVLTRGWHMRDLAVSFSPVCAWWQASGTSVATSGVSAQALSAKVMQKDSWDRYTQDELRDDLLDFCRDDFEFESTEV